MIVKEKKWDFSNYIKEILRKINVYICYTFIFGIICLLIFYTYIKFGKSFIWYPDGFKQHYIILYDFNTMIKNIFENGISLFSWDMGLGLDIIGQYSYYILGDPFAYISLLFHIKYLKYVYQILVIFRIYLVGIAFIVYCRYNKKNNYSTIIGAIIYTFSGYILYASVRHPYFTNPVIMLPLVFLGLDKILKEDKYIWFISTIAILALMNYYFLYMITILSVIYAVVKYIVEYRQNGIKEFRRKFAKTLIAYIIGIMVVGIILLPTIYAFLDSGRTEMNYTYYDLEYYQKLFFGQSDTPFWSKSYVSSLLLLILPVAILNFKKSKENKTTLINIVISIIILVVPFLGSVMNGFSFQSNRWIFVYSFYMAYLVVINLREDLKYTTKEIISMFSTLILYLLLLLHVNNIDKQLTIKLVLITAIIGLVILIKKIYPKYSRNFLQVSKVAIIIIVSANIVTYAWSLYNLEGKKYAFQFIRLSKLDNMYNNYEDKVKDFDKTIDYLKETDTDFYRIGVPVYNINNISTMLNYKGLKSYLSIGNGYVNRLVEDLLVPGNDMSCALNKLNELDSRTKITTLLGCKYYIVPNNKKDYVPYDYKLIKEYKDTKIFENKQYLTIGVFYDNYIMRDDYECLSALEKEQALLETAVIENNSEIEDINIDYNKKLKSAIKDTTQEIDFKIVDEEKYLKDKRFIIKFDDVANCELYLYLENLKYDSTDSYLVNINYNSIEKKEIIQDKLKSAYYEEKVNCLFNLGYKEKHSGKIEINLTGKRKLYL